MMAQALTRHMREAENYFTMFVLTLALCAAFWKGWDMTLVILAAMPVLIIVGAAIGTVTASLGKVAAGNSSPECTSDAASLETPNARPDVLVCAACSL